MIQHLFDALIVKVGAASLENGNLPAISEYSNRL